MKGLEGALFSHRSRANASKKKRLKFCPDHLGARNAGGTRAETAQRGGPGSRDPLSLEQHAMSGERTQRHLGALAEQVDGRTADDPALGCIDDVLHEESPWNRRWRTCPARGCRPAAFEIDIKAVPDRHLISLPCGLCGATLVLAPVDGEQPLARRLALDQISRAHESATKRLRGLL